MTPNPHPSLPITIASFLFIPPVFLTKKRPLQKSSPSLRCMSANAICFGFSLTICFPRPERRISCALVSSPWVTSCGRRRSNRRSPFSLRLSHYSGELNNSIIIMIILIVVKIIITLKLMMIIIIIIIIIIKKKLKKK